MARLLLIGSIVCVFLYCLPGCFGIICYQCYWNPVTREGDEGCTENWLTINSSLAHQCPVATATDACFTRYTKDERGYEFYQRGCADRSLFDDKISRCKDCELWGYENTLCICSLDYCNGGERGMLGSLGIIPVFTLIMFNNLFN